MSGEDRLLFAGIDGGQSSTQAVIVTASGVVLGRGTAGPADHVDEPAGSRRCADACEGAVARALTAAGLPATAELQTVVIGLSGYDGAVHGVAPAFGRARVIFAHDAPVALAGAVDGRPGVIVIAGTGSVAYGEDAGGTAVRVGGYGYLFGDAGSSFVLARDALAAAMELADRGTASRLGDAALAFFDRPDLRALARSFYLREISRPQLASFARVILDAARLGDGDAADLVTRAARALAGLAALTIERLGLQGVAVPVALSGGLFANADFYRRTAEQVAAFAPGALAVQPSSDPATGAARMAIAAG